MEIRSAENSKFVKMILIFLAISRYDEKKNNKFYNNQKKTNPRLKKEKTVIR